MTTSENQFIVVAGTFISQPVGPFSTYAEAETWYQASVPKCKYPAEPTIRRLLAPYTPLIATTEES